MHYIVLQGATYTRLDGWRARFVLISIDWFCDLKTSFQSCFLPCAQFMQMSLKCPRSAWRGHKVAIIIKIIQSFYRSVSLSWRRRSRGRKTSVTSFFYAACSQLINRFFRVWRNSKSIPLASSTVVLATKPFLVGFFQWPSLDCLWWKLTTDTGSDEQHVQCNVCVWSQLILFICFLSGSMFRRVPSISMLSFTVACAIRRIFWDDTWLSTRFAETETEHSKEFKRMIRHIPHNSGRRQD